MSASSLVVDTSAVVAVLFNESGAEWLVETLAGGEQRLASAATHLELGIILESRFGPTGTGAAERFMREAQIEIVDVTPQVAQRSLEGWRRFGKGRHAAGLNFGDCFVYGLASERDLPILCVSGDFAKTDVEILMPPVSVAEEGS